MMSDWDLEPMAESARKQHWNGPHCCTVMNAQLTSMPRIFEHLDKSNEYIIKDPSDEHKFVFIFFCNFCGKKLPIKKGRKYGEGK